MIDGGERYLPPPAQAQAQPAQAQAQAQAQWLPPLPPPLPPPLLEVLTGTGLVLLVIPLVKEATSPITPDEKLLTPFTIEAAKADPGRLGSEGCPVDPGEMLGEMLGPA